MKRIIIGGRGMREGLGLDLLMGLLAGAGRESGPCGGLEGLESHNCDECLSQGECSIESRMRERKKGQVEVSGVDDVKSADLLLADAKMAGQKAQVSHLENVLTALREKIDEMDAAHKAELEQLTSRNKEELARLTRRHFTEVEDLQRTLRRNRQANDEISGELELALQKVSTVQSIVLSYGYKRQSRRFLAALRKGLDMPPLEKPKKATTSAT